MKKAPCARQGTEGGFTPRYHLILPPRRGRSPDPYISFALYRGRSPDTYISFALYRAHPAFLFPFGFRSPLRRVFKQNSPAASHHPAALWTENLSAYWISFIAIPILMWFAFSVKSLNNERTMLPAIDKSVPDVIMTAFLREQRRWGCRFPAERAPARPLEPV